jgi:hypothetical protein
MLQDVGQSFLDHPVDDGFDFRRKPVADPKRLDVDRNSVSVAPSRRIGGKRLFQPEIIERARAQIGGGTMQVAADIRRQLAQSMHPFGQRLVLPVPLDHLFEPLEPERQARHGLSDLIMQFARDMPALILLRLRQSPEQCDVLCIRLLAKIYVRDDALNEFGTGLVDYAKPVPGWISVAGR